MSVIIIQDKEKDYRINYSIAVFLLKQNSVFDKVDGIFRSKYHTEHRQQSSLVHSPGQIVWLCGSMILIDQLLQNFS